MLSFGKDGYRRIAADIFRTAAAMKAAVRSHEELALIGDGLFNVAFRDLRPRSTSTTSTIRWRLRLADERPAAPAGAALLRHPTEHPARRRRGVRPTSPRRGVRQGPAAADAASGAMYGAGGQSRPSAWSSDVRPLDAIHEVGPLDPVR